MTTDRDKVVEVRTYIHTADITFLNDDEAGASVYVRGVDRCGWEFSGFMDRAALAPILFPEGNNG
jgi:hypothetical protein